VGDCLVVSFTHRYALAPAILDLDWFLLLWYWISTARLTRQLVHFLFAANTRDAVILMAVASSRSQKSSYFVVDQSKSVLMHGTLLSPCPISSSSSKHTQKWRGQP
jgi:hypothetical protein